MADLPIVVDRLKLSGSRIDAQVIMGATRVYTTLDTRSPEVTEALTPLLKVIEESVKGDIAAQLELYLSPTSKEALRH